MMILNILGTLLGMSNNNSAAASSAASSVASSVTAGLSGLQLPPQVAAGFGAAAGAATMFAFPQSNASVAGAAIGTLAASVLLPTDPKKLAGAAFVVGMTSAANAVARNSSTNADEETKAQLAVAERNKQEAERVAAETRALNHRVWLYERKVTTT